MMMMMMMMMMMDQDLSLWNTRPYSWYELYQSNCVHYRLRILLHNYKNNF